MNDQRCQDCQAIYDEVMPCSLNLPREQWEKVCPEEGLLCANCIVKRAAKLPNVICLQAKVMFASDF